MNIIDKSQRTYVELDTLAHGSVFKHNIKIYLLTDRIGTTEICCFNLTDNCTAHFDRAVKVELVDASLVITNKNSAEE